MLLDLPVEILLEVTDHLAPADISSLSQMGELAFLFHHITDQSLTGSTDTLYFHPHPAVQCSQLFGHVAIDTSRYYLIEVKGAQSLVVAGDRTRHTRRVMAVLNQIMDFTLDIKTIVKPQLYRHKYVFTGFPAMVIRKLEIDPKMVEIRQSTSVTMMDTCSVDDTFKLAMHSVEDIHIANCHENVFDNVDFASVPFNSLTVHFPKHRPMDLHVGQATHAMLLDYDHLKHCHLANVETLELRPLNGSHMDWLDAPRLTTMSVICDTIAPRVDHLHTPLLDHLSVYEQSLFGQAQEREIIMADQYGITSDTLFTNVDLWCNLKTLSLLVHSSRMFAYIHHATNLEYFELKVNCVLEPSITKNLKFPNLKKLKIVIRIHAIDYIPQFSIEPLEVLHIEADNRIADYARLEPLHLEKAYPNLKRLTLDHLALPAIQKALGHSHFPKLTHLAILRTDTPSSPRFHTLAHFPQVTELELNCLLQDLTKVQIMLDTPQLTQLICKLERTLRDVVEFGRAHNVNPWGDFNLQQSSILSIDGYSSLHKLIVSGVTEIHLSHTPSVCDIIHGGVVDLEKLECDESVQHLHSLVYRNRSPVVPIQSVVCVCPGLVRKVYHSTVHPMDDVFTY